MKKNTRFLRSIKKTASETDVDLPWTRGAGRAARIARRDAPVRQLKSA